MVPDILVEQAAASLRTVCELIRAHPRGLATLVAGSASDFSNYFESTLRASMRRTGRSIIRAIDTPSSMTGRIPGWLAKSARFSQQGPNWRVVLVPAHGQGSLGASAVGDMTPDCGIETVSIAPSSPLTTPPSLYIINADLAVLPSHGTDDGMTVVEFRPAVAAMASVFDGLWLAATIGTIGGRSTPPPHLMEVLEELASGVLDRTAQRRLNMSSRTFNRRSAELLRALNSTSRFQAGVEAGRRGWV